MNDVALTAQATHDDPYLETREALGSLRDFHLPFYQIDDEKLKPEDQVDSGFAWSPDGQKYSLKDQPKTREWMILFLDAIKEKGSKLLEFSHDFKGERFRCHRQRTPTGWMLVLRRIADIVPKLDELAMPFAWRSVLTSAALKSGGLGIFAAETGQGKTTTASSMVVTRLERFGGFALTVEDPVELRMMGEWGENGLCVQSSVEPGIEGASTHEEVLAGALRSYPAFPGNILFIGEIRDHFTATQAIIAANNGHLVLCTLHANSIVGAIKRLLAMSRTDLGREESCQLLASAFRFCIHQTKQWNPKAEGWQRGRLTGEALFSKGPSDGGVAGAIQSGKIHSLTQIISEQQNRIEQIEREARRGTAITGHFSLRKILGESG